MRVLFIALCVLLSSCASVPDALKPRINSVSSEFNNIDLQGVEITVLLDVNNPYPFPLQSPDLNYRIQVQGNELVSTSKALALDLPALSNGVIRLPIRISYLDVIATAKTLKHANRFQYSLTGDVSFSIAGQKIALPYTYRDELPIVRIPTVRNIKIENTSLGLSKATIEISADVSNPNSFALDTRAIQFNGKLAGQEISSLQALQGGVISAESSGRIKFRFNLGLGSVVSRLMSGDLSGLKDFQMEQSGKISTPYGTVDLSPK